MKMLLNFKKIFLSFIDLFKPNKNKTYRTVYVEELPDIVEIEKIYILGEGQYLWSAAMKCPCNCKNVLQMSLHQDGTPRWNLTIHDNGTVSLYPSIWRKVGCKSHFFFKEGKIQWCN
jgi:Family of unknown function (DUF6527)